MGGGSGRSIRILFDQRSCAGTGGNQLIIVVEKTPLKKSNRISEMNDPAPPQKKSRFRRGNKTDLELKGWKRLAGFKLGRKRLA